jgi:hypothetical protein
MLSLMEFPSFLIIWEYQLQKHHAQLISNILFYKEQQTTQVRPGIFRLLALLMEKIFR